ncbi:DmpA family aminopeptidase [Ameyamaea chiangmaiensis]|nr:P1 family peptidase [Ameyamaea chiangmaiensis]
MHAHSPVARRARELGLPMPGTPGPLNAITDVPGVRVGHVTLNEDRDGKTVRTGVTAILPRAPEDLLHPVWAGAFSMNGNGELTGCHWIDESGWMTGPITITNTCSLGIAHHATARWLARQFPEKIGETIWPLPVVGETFDGWLNDIAGQHVTETDVLTAIDTASGGAVAEGCVGGGTGMIAYEFKAGSGTSSRQVTTGDGTYTLGVIVQANHGLRPWLTVCGAPVGVGMTGDRLWASERGSIIVVLATDAPFGPTEMRRIAKRISIGIGRGGTPSGDSSGDIFVAFTTANDPGEVPLPTSMSIKTLGNSCMDAFFTAAVEATDEAIVNALVAAQTMTGKHGRTVHAIDTEQLRHTVRRFHGLDTKDRP